MTIDKEKLEPCPFCGGEVQLETVKSRAGTLYGVVCRNTTSRGCTCAMEQVPSRTAEAAIARWNMRRPEDELRAEIEQLQAHKQGLIDLRETHGFGSWAAALCEIDRLRAERSKKERELEQELEVWRAGPACWTCGDTGDVHDITGEWRGECDCLAAQLINANRERNQLKAENEALRKDAERYRWLTEKAGPSWGDMLGDKSATPAEKADEIDAAMAKEASHG